MTHLYSGVYEPISTQPGMTASVLCSFTSVSLAFNFIQDHMCTEAKNMKFLCCKAYWI